MNRLIGVILAVALAVAPVAAQLPAMPYPNFTPGAIIASGEVNSNFSIVADYALKRNGGGIIEGPITVDPGVTIDGVDISAFLSPTGRIYSQVAGLVGTPAYRPSTDPTTGMFFGTGALAWALSGNERMRLDGTGLTVRGNLIFNTSGKIPALTTTYFASVAADQLQLAETSFTDGTVYPRLAANETITGTYSYAPTDQSNSKPLAYSATWNNGATTFLGLEYNITNTASAAASNFWQVRLAGTAKISTGVGGKTVIVAPKITAGAANAYFLVGDGNGTGTWLPSASAVPVPSGMIGFFEAACPLAWTSRGALTELYNAKFLRGGASFDSSGGGANSHLHTVDPPITTSSSESVDHTHTADLVIGTVSSTGAHEHPISANTNNSDANHTHTFTTDASGGGQVDCCFLSPFAATGHTHSGTTDGGALIHTHSIGGFTSRDGDHNHTVDYPNTTSSGRSAAHTHTLDIAAFNSSTDTAIPAYVQVIVCKKD